MSVAGNSRVLCGGRCVTGPDSSGITGTIFIIALPSLVYFVFLMPYLFEKQLYFLAAVPLYLIPHSFVLLFITACSDPGIIPRQPAPPSEPHSSIVTASQVSKELSHPQFKDIESHDELGLVKVRCKYCHTCHIYRPDRASHDRQSDNCVHNFDHFCPWVSNTVARNNYKYFIYFVSSVMLEGLWLLMLGIVGLVLTTGDVEETGFAALGAAMYEHTAPAATSAFLLFYIFYALWSVSGLWGYHVNLTCKNQTTYESMMGHYRFDDSERNPRDRGWKYNLTMAWCAPRWPDIWLRSMRASSHETDARNAL